MLKQLPEGGTEETKSGSQSEERLAGFRAECQELPCGKVEVEGEPRLDRPPPRVQGGCL